MLQHLKTIGLETEHLCLGSSLSSLCLFPQLLPAPSHLCSASYAVCWWLLCCMDFASVLSMYVEQRHTFSVSEILIRVGIDAESPKFDIVLFICFH